MRENSLRLFCSNVRGLVCNWDAATSFDWSNFDILAFNEVWSIKEFENLSVNNYEVKSVKLRANRRGGGTIIYGRNDLECVSIETPFKEGCIESTGIKIGDVVFVNVYRPPNGNRVDFSNNLTQFIGSLRSSKLIISGDFNVNYYTDAPWYNDICHGFGLAAKITTTTRVTSGTCIDNILSSIDGQYNVSDISIADHQAVIAEISFDKSQSNSSKQNFFYRQMKEANYALFNHKLYNEVIVGGINIEEKWSNLQNTIHDLVEECFPKKSSNRRYVFSMSQGLLKSRDKKNLLLRQYKNGRINKEVYTEYNKIYRKLIKTEQTKVFNSSLSNAGTDGRKKWKVIKQHLHLESSRVTIESLEVNGEVITSKADIAKSFKTHFETCAQKLAENLPQGQDTSSIMQGGEQWSFRHTSVADLLKIIRSLKNKNSAGIDCLSNHMLKKEAYRFSVLLTPLINEALDEGIFPSCLKKANIIPIFKKGDKTNLNNYRPIALLPVLSKVFEKVLNEQLTSIIDNGFIDDNQFGFRRGFSTEDAAIKFVNQIQKDLNLKKHVVTVYVDVSKAFDSCDHKILMKKIEKTGLDITGLNLMRSYLLNRSQSVSVDGIHGGTFLVNIGVGQGTILGPTLFKIYIMDLHLYTKLFCVKFADDSSFEGSGRTKDEVEQLMNSELVNIADWFKKNRLTLHPNKSRFIIHSKDKLINLNLAGTPILRCGYGLQEESVKLLGLHIDENLDWKIHVDSVSKKISKGSYLLWRHKSKLDNKTKKNLYECFIRCHILYCLTVWGGAKPSKLKPLINAIKKSWKYIGPFKQHTLNRLKKNNILKFEDELAVAESKLIWRWEKNKIPKALKSIVIEKPGNLRRRRFATSSNSPLDSIESRLSKRASLSIATITKFNSKKSLANNLKKAIINNQYSFACTRNNCYICAG